MSYTVSISQSIASLCTSRLRTPQLLYLSKFAILFTLIKDRLIYFQGKYSNMLYRTVISAIAVALLVTFSSAKNVGHGKTDLDEEWSFLCYENEPFMLYCNSSELSVQTTDYIMWEKPSKVGDTLTFKRNHNDMNYQTNEYFGVEGFQLHIKKVTPETSGVFVCHVHDGGTGISRARAIVGINIRERKYEEMFDKYRWHFIVAVIATAVFVIPLATICIVYQFRYERRMDKKMTYTYNGRGHEMKRYPDGLADTVQAPEGKGAYENPEFAREPSLGSSTNL